MKKDKRIANLKAKIQDYENSLASQREDMINTLNSVINEIKENNNMGMWVLNIVKSNVELYECVKADKAKIEYALKLIEKTE